MIEVGKNPNTLYTHLIMAMAKVNQHQEKFLLTNNKTSFHHQVTLATFSYLGKVSLKKTSEKRLKVAI